MPVIRTNFAAQMRLARFRFGLRLQRLWASLIDQLLPWPAPTGLRASGLIASLNTRAALRLCLASLERHRISPPLPLLIADNASSDGSAEWLQSYARSHPNVRLMLHPEIRWHGLWIDQALEEAQGDLLFVIDSDLIVLGDSLIRRCQAYMRRHPECLILHADPWCPGQAAQRQGTDAPLVEPSLSTWFLCIRTSLRQHSKASFVAVFPEQQPPRQGRAVMSDTGAKLIQDLQAQGLSQAVQVVPRLWRPLFHHIGSLSWLQWADSSGAWMAYKQAQLRWLEQQGEMLTRTKWAR